MIRHILVDHMSEKYIRANLSSYCERNSSFSFRTLGAACRVRPNALETCCVNEFGNYFMTADSKE